MQIESKQLHGDNRKKKKFVSRRKLCHRPPEVRQINTIKCPQLSKPKAKATMTRNQKVQPKKFSSPLADERTVYDYDSGNIASQVGSEHSQYLSRSI